MLFVFGSTGSSWRPSVGVGRRTSIEASSFQNLQIAWATSAV
jgi:hypothetical protein